MVEKFPFAFDFLPPFIPSGKWRINVDLVTNKKKAATIQIFITIGSGY